MVAAIIVLYNSNLALLERLLRGIVGQVEKVFVIDNTPGYNKCFSAYFEKYQDCVSYIPLGDNKGIAIAQNIGIRASMDAGYSHVLLLDQDSIIPDGMVKRLLDAEAELILAGEKIAAVGPYFVDEKTGRGSFAVRCGVFCVNRIYINANSKIPVETDYLVASGSLIRVSILHSVGFMRDDLFIDWVDTEWALRARSLGYKSYYVPEAVMMHNVGDSVIRVLGRDLHIHNDIRNYYLIRNAIYLMRLKSMGLKWKITFFPRIPFYLVLYPLLSANKLRNASMLVKGVYDGIRGKMGPLR